VKIAIAQPTYLPWLGYFDLIDQVDKFVLLDTVQFEKQSWQQRNRIKAPTGLEWLTVPVKIKGRSTQIIVASRNVAATPPYFHDGSTQTLDDAVRKMGLAQLNATLTDQQVQAIVAYLQTLTGNYRGRSVGVPP